jgi:hypothetical protein
MWEKKIKEVVSSYIFFSHIFLPGDFIYYKPAVP